MDQQEFGTLVEHYQRELHVHCYRLMGSIHDADDMVQETFLRAWRRRETLEGLSLLRAWLYRIATNVCLDALKRRPERFVPSSRAPASSLAEPIAPEILEPIWLEPYPDTLLPAGDLNPEEQVAAREQIAMAFVVALHRLPPRQRAVLLLRDVLEWPASEVAALLDTTISAVKSALHRARSMLAEHRTTPDTDYDWTLDSAAQMQLDTYMRAWESADITTLVRLLREDASFSMPPIPDWYLGREAIRALLAGTVLGGAAECRWRLVPTRANRQPAFGVYCRSEIPGRHTAYGIQVLTLHGRQISDITTFRDARLVAHFNLPISVPSCRN